MRFMPVMLLVAAILHPAAASARLRMDDKASLWARAAAADKIDFADRMGKSMRTLSQQLSSGYFMQCLEETANIGDTKELTLGDMIRTCISIKMSNPEEQYEHNGAIE